MTRDIVFRIVSGLVLVAALVGIAYFAFNAGVAQGVGMSGEKQVGSPGELPVPYYRFGWYPHFFPGFGCFGLFFLVFLLFVAFGAFRRMLWGPLWGWHHKGHGPWRGHGPWGKDVPPMFDRWHRRAHGEEPDEGENE